MRGQITVLLLFALLNQAPVGLAQAVGRGGAPPLTPASQEAFVLINGIPEPRIGPNDLLQITVWNGESVEEQIVRVAQDGTIFVPFGVNRTFRVTGLSSTDLKQAIQGELSQFFRQTVTQVVIQEYHSNRAYLLGEIRVAAGAGPGLYPLEGRKRVLEFIIEHGGFTENANLTKVQVNRATGEVETLNLSDVIFQGDEKQDVVVHPGDIVWVPGKEVGANTYYVFGEVTDPGVVTAQNALSVVEVISRSGSFTADASRDDVFIARGNLDQPEIVKLDLKRLVEKADFSQNAILQNNDIIFVPARGLSKFRDVIAAITPILGLIRDTVFLVEIRRNR